MDDRRFDFAVVGSTPLAGLLAGLLADPHGHRVCLIGERWSPFQLTRRFDLSVMAMTRPESWALLRTSSEETLKLLRGLGRGLFERVDPLFIAETPQSIDFLAHMRHMARASGYGAEPVASRRLPGSGCRLRDAALLVPGRIEAALAGWLDALGVPQLHVPADRLQLRRDGSLQCRHDGATVDAERTVLADDAAILTCLEPDGRDRVLRLRPAASILTEPAPPLPARLVQYLDRDVMLAQAGRRGGPIHALVSGATAVLPRLGSVIASRGPLRRSGHAVLAGIETADGAPLLGPARGRKVLVVTGFGTGGAFLAPAIARAIAGRGTPEEQRYFAARGPSRGHPRRLVADGMPAFEATA